MLHNRQRRTVAERPKSLSSVETGCNSEPKLSKRWSRSKRRRRGKHSNHCHGKKRINNFEIKNTEPDEPIMMLRSSHYVVGSIGLSRRHMRPYHIVMDTGAGFNVIRSSALPDGWQHKLIPDCQLPNLSDANGKPFRLQ